MVCKQEGMLQIEVLYVTVGQPIMWPCTHSLLLRPGFVDLTMMALHLSLQNADEVQQESSRLN